MVTAYFVMAGLGVVLWLPILLRFYKSWLGRHNPISLAICATIMLLVWAMVAGAWVVTGSLSACIIALVSAGMSTAVAAYAHLAFYWSARKFPDKRKKE
jgi:hypothetical protein